MFNEGDIVKSKFPATLGEIGTVIMKRKNNDRIYIVMGLNGSSITINEKEECYKSKYYKANSILSAYSECFLESCITNKQRLVNHLLKICFK